MRHSLPLAALLLTLATPPADQSGPARAPAPGGLRGQPLPCRVISPMTTMENPSVMNKEAFMGTLTHQPHRYCFMGSAHLQHIHAGA